MLVVRNYRGHRIEVAAVAADDGRFNAVVSIRRASMRERAAVETVETVECVKINAVLAEQAGERWAKRWIDLNAKADA